MPSSQATKARVLVLFAIAVAAFIASYTVGDAYTQLLFVVIAVACLFISGRMAMKMQKESAK
jgi:hypothetical protein